MIAVRRIAAQLFVVAALTAGPVTARAVEGEDAGAGAPVATVFRSSTSGSR